MATIAARTSVLVTVFTVFESGVLPILTLIDELFLYIITLILIAKRGVKKETDAFLGYLSLTLSSAFSS